MRKSTRLRLFLAVASVSALAAAFVAACGGSDEQDVTATPDSGADTTRPDTGGGAIDTGAPDTSKPDTGPPDAGPQYDAGAPTILEAGPEYDGGIACVVGGQIEQEPNDTTLTANELRVTPDAGCVGNGCSRCGVCSAPADAGTDSGGGGLDVDYVTFQVHPATKSFYVQYAGNVTLTVTVEGDSNTYVINGSSSPTLPYAAGKDYFVEIRSNTGAQTAWRVTLFENQ